MFRFKNSNLHFSARVSGQLQVYTVVAKWMAVAILHPGRLCKTKPHSPKTQRNDSLKVSPEHTNNMMAATQKPLMQERLQLSGGRKLSKEIIHLKERQTFLQQ